MRINGRIWESRRGLVREGIVLDVPKVSQSTRFRYDAERRRLKGADESLELCLRAGAQILAFFKLHCDNLSKSLGVFQEVNGTLIRRDLGTSDRGNV
jgi:hypothetical protein